MCSAQETASLTSKNWRATVASAGKVVVKKFPSHPLGMSYACFACKVDCLVASAKQLNPETSNNVLLDACSVVALQGFHTWESLGMVDVEDIVL